MKKPKPLDEDDRKELADLTRLVSGGKPPRAQNLNQKEAQAIVDYVDELEKIVGVKTFQLEHSGRYDSRAKGIGMLKLFGIAAGLPYESDTANPEEPT